jgi:peptide-methionine (S)-S-oxide reductase
MPFPAANTRLLIAPVLLAAGLAHAAAGDGEQNTARATLAGGCFWCMEPPFDKLDGVISTTSGYTGGDTEDPDYEQVSSGQTGHTEAVRIVYDPDQIDYGELLHVYWRNIDPTTENAQFCDHGSQYRAEIFYHNEKQKRLAEQTRAELKANGPFEKPIVTPITEASEFYPAEEYHQDYYKKNPLRYKFYRFQCGRDQFLDKYWD